MIDINGEWIGFYNYGSAYSEMTQLESIPFNVTIKNGFTSFIGRILEEPEYGGIDDKIMIKGKLENDVIEFDKYYTKDHFVDDDNVSYSQPSDNPTVVHYQGTYDHVQHKFIGTWIIGFLREIDDETMVPENSSGGWEMWRQ